MWNTAPWSTKQEHSAFSSALERRHTAVSLETLRAFCRRKSAAAETESPEPRQDPATKAENPQGAVQSCVRDAFLSWNQFRPQAKAHCEAACTVTDVDWDMTGGPAVYGCSSVETSSSPFEEARNKLEPPAAARARGPPPKGKPTLVADMPKIESERMEAPEVLLSKLFPDNHMQTGGVHRSQVLSARLQKMESDIEQIVQKLNDLPTSADMESLKQTLESQGRVLKILLEGSREMFTQLSETIPHRQNPATEHYELQSSTRFYDDVSDGPLPGW